MLKLNGISKWFGDKLIFKDVNLELGPSQGVLVIGPNGCGKSTLLKIIAGILRPSKGSITNQGIDKIGYMGHYLSVYSNLTAYENLKFWSNIYKLGFNKQDLLKFLKKVGLGSVAFERTSIFSRGMIQRLNIARIMIIDPDIYLLDEPETGLDTQSKSMFFHMIETALFKKKIVIWVTHNVSHNYINTKLVYRDKTFLLE